MSTHVMTTTTSEAPDPTLASPTLLPPNFLSAPGPPVSVQRIDFSKTSLPEYHDLYAVILDNVLTASECQLLVRAAEQSTKHGWEPAMVNVGMGMQKLILDSRNCGRIIWDDREVVGKIWDRCKEHVPEIETLNDMPHVTGNGPVKRREVLRLSRLNERMRFLKYGSGQYFRRESSRCSHLHGTDDGDSALRWGL